MREGAQLRVGLVGPGRTRDGLGPWLARHVESGGGRIVAVSGRDLERTRAAAKGLGDDLGHEVLACEDLRELTAQTLDALVVATPTEVHIDGLRAAIWAGLPVLCEKPIVDPSQMDAVPELLAAFREGGLLVMENCQWPDVLPVVGELYPERGIGSTEAVERVDMGLSPSGTGPVMLVDSLSHYLSVIQALWPVGRGTGITRLAFAGDVAQGGLEFDIELQNPDGRRLAGHFEVRQCVAQPRPAWIAVNGARIDRHIEASGYRISFVGNQKTAPIGDPTTLLVYRFLELVREVQIDRIRDESQRIEQRARLYVRVYADFEGYAHG